MVSYCIYYTPYVHIGNVCAINCKNQNFVSISAPNENSNKLMAVCAVVSEVFLSQARAELRSVTFFDNNNNVSPKN